MEEGRQGGEEGSENRAMTESFLNRPRTGSRAVAGLVGWWSLAAIVALVHNRLWGTPNLALFSTISSRLGENPFAGSPIEGDYLLSNLLGAAIARGLGQTDAHEYARLHLILFGAGMIAVMVGAYRRFGYATARALLALCAFAPATTVVMQWLGQPDALTLPLALGIVIARPNWMKLALGVLLGLSHSEQGLAAALIAGLAAVAIEAVIGDTFEPVDGSHEASGFAAGAASGAVAKVAAVAAVVPMVGVLVGRGIVEIYFRVNDIVIETPRTSFLEFGLGNFVDHHLTAPGWLLWSLWGPLWVGAIAGAVWLRRSPAATTEQRFAAVVIAIGAVAGLVPMFITLDQTRVYSLVTAPLLVAVAVVVAQSVWPERSRPIGWQPLLGAAVLMFVPGMFCAGEAYFATSLSPIEFVGWLFDGEVPYGQGVTDFLMGPFGFEPPDI